MNGIQNSPFRSVKTFKNNEEKHNKDENHSKVQIAQNDPFMKWPLRGLAYTNELGECLRPVIGPWAWAFWAPAVAYIGADVSDKYKKGPDGVEDPSGKRAAKQLSFQTLASVLLPTAAVKLGNFAVNRASAFDKSKLTFEDREKITNGVVESMSKGTHMSDTFFDAATNSVDRKKYIEHFVSSFHTKDENAKAGGSKLKGFARKIYNVVKRPFSASATEENIRRYTEKTVNEVMDVYDSLRQNVKPEKMSQKKFAKFQELSKQVGAETAAFHTIEKMQKSKIFKNNKMLIAAGGFLSLGLLMKPIDNFVENTLIEKYIEPTIYNFDKRQPLKSFTDAVNFQRRKTKDV